MAQREKGIKIRDSGWKFGVKEGGRGVKMMHAKAGWEGAPHRIQAMTGWAANTAVELRVELSSMRLIKLV